VAVTIVHGDADLNVPIQGGASRLYPRADTLRSIRSWALGGVWNGCGSAPTERVEGSV